ncbi:RhuM family protein [Hyphomicrobium sp.]|jgi:hypothetical protein|uniref:RhuM family protein n=1 Tax=Hyphomicrobium sp. TaxID=82 RepID=UPI002BD15C0F|nr:RhuM family protein [Hyphomicrobium sp.]HVZ05386.1 RhuM family protein [Hyphomicrobium sp.]
MAKFTRKHQKPPAIDADFDETLRRFARTDTKQVDAEIAKEDSERPVRLVGHEDSAHPLLIYATPKGINVELPFRDGTFWATQDQMAEMFGVDRTSITKHLANIYAEGELHKAATCEEISQVRQEGSRSVRRERPVYNLNAMISVGYRVGSTQGTMFRIWATDKLVQILTKGFYVDVERLKNQGEPGALDEFRKIAREIRTSIRNSYREVLRLCTLCSDYDGSIAAARAFFMDMENKLLWASSGRTAPQLILERCDAEKPDLGLTYYAGKRGPTQNDVKIGNNYLAQGEAERKNRATEMWLDYVEEQLDQGRLPTMAAVREKLIGFINFNQWPLLKDFGLSKREDADAHALEQLELYRERMKAEAEARKPEKVDKKK